MIFRWKNTNYPLTRNLTWINFQWCKMTSRLLSLIYMEILLDLVLFFPSFLIYAILLLYLITRWSDVFSDYNWDFRVDVWLFVKSFSPLLLSLHLSFLFLFYDMYTASTICEVGALLHVFDFIYQWSVLARIFRVRVCILIHWSSCAKKIWVFKVLFSFPMSENYDRYLI